jgi:DNA-directed RNA polymerase subunit RPC12/RpoP
MTCIVCKTNYASAQGQAYSRCPECGHEMLTDNRTQTYIINDAIDTALPEAKSGLDKFKRKTALTRANRRETLVDIGCGPGAFPYQIKPDFKRTIGVEVTPECIEFARTKLNLEIHERLTPLEQAPSVVTGWHSFEHLPDRELENTLGWLKSNCADDSVVIVSVPNAASFQSSWFGRKYAYYDVPNHIHQFTTRSLDRLFTNYGFIRKSRVFSFPYLWFGYLQGFLNVFNSIHNYLYYRKKRGWTYNKSRAQLRLLDFYNYALVALFLPVAFGMTVLDWLFPSRAGVITHIYQKA